MVPSKKRYLLPFWNIFIFAIIAPITQRGILFEVSKCLFRGTFLKKKGPRGVLFFFKVSFMKKYLFLIKKKYFFSVLGAIVKFENVSKMYLLPKRDHLKILTFWRDSLYMSYMHTKYEKNWRTLLISISVTLSVTNYWKKIQF